MNNPTSTISILNVTPALRGDLRFGLQAHGAESCYLIEDERNGKFYRVGLPEYQFISLLDGTCSIREALAHTSRVLGADAFTEQDAAVLCEWLIESQLAETSDSSEGSRLAARSEEARKGKQRGNLNPLMIKLPAIHPDYWITSLTTVCGAWFSWPAFVVWLGVLVWTVAAVLSDGDRAWSETTPLLTSGNLPWLLGTWCLLKLVHELSHAVACKRFGGNVREAGLMLMLFAPVPYVDVTSSWRFASKWMRIVVALAGMYSELFVAALAAQIWLWAPPGQAKLLASNVMLTASVVTLLFNANPLMRFDGYYILADLLEIPNLYGLGQQYVSYLGRKYALGVPARVPAWGRFQGIAIRTYGIAATAWRLLVSVGLVLTTSVLFQGTGVLLSLVAAILWFLLPTIKFIRYLLWGNLHERPDLARFGVTALTLTLALVAIGILPEPGGIRAPGVVGYADRQVVRAPFAGFVRQVHVQGGQSVREGEPLITLENLELAADTAQILCAARISGIRGRGYQESGEIAAAQAETSERESLEQQGAEQQARLAKSPLLASREGVVLRRDVGELIGRYVEEGEELLVLAQERKKEVRWVANQMDEPYFRSHQGDRVLVHVERPQVGRISCILGTVEPNATLDPPDATLLVPYGGPLPARLDAKGDVNGDAESGPSYRFLEPHFAGRIVLDESNATRLLAGERVTVRLRVSRGTVAAWIVREARDWIDARLRQAGARD